MAAVSPSNCCHNTNTVEQSRKIGDLTEADRLTSACSGHGPRAADANRSGRPQAAGLNGAADEPRWLRPRGGGCNQRMEATARRATAHPPPR